MPLERTGQGVRVVDDVGVAVVERDGVHSDKEWRRRQGGYGLCGQRECLWK